MCRLVLMASGDAGDGIGRYLDSTSNGYGAVYNAGLPGVASNTTEYQCTRHLRRQYFFTPAIRTNMSIGGARIILPSYTSQFGGCVDAFIGHLLVHQLVRSVRNDQPHIGARSRRWISVSNTSMSNGIYKRPSWQAPTLPPPVASRTGSWLPPSRDFDRGGGIEDLCCPGPPPLVFVPSRPVSHKRRCP